MYFVNVDLMKKEDWIKSICECVIKKEEIIKGMHFRKVFVRIVYTLALFRKCKGTFYHSTDLKSFNKVDRMQDNSV